MYIVCKKILYQVYKDLIKNDKDVEKLRRVQ